ncbi:MAG: head-tail adaptor protein, partial [Flavobacteriaceae bacterium]|nr:head-tail adaptor protein [Flavobacteriaceae bacterium]
MSCKGIPVKNLNQKATVQTRAMVGSHLGVTDLTERFVDLGVLWGKFETNGNGYQSFGGVGVSETITHKFTTRYTSVVTVTDQEWLLYDGVRYK